MGSRILFASHSFSGRHLYFWFHPSTHFRIFNSKKSPVTSAWWIRINSIAESNIDNHLGHIWRCYCGKRHLCSTRLMECCDCVVPGTLVPKQRTTSRGSCLRLAFHRRRPDDSFNYFGPDLIVMLIWAWLIEINFHGANYQRIGGSSCKLTLCRLQVINSLFFFK